VALTFSLVDSCEDGKRVHVSDTLVASRNDTPTGDTLDLSEVPVIASDQTPVQGTAWMDGPAGYDYVFLSMGTSMLFTPITARLSFGCGPRCQQGTPETRK
jgi:hypothetical protein